ncbi:hypothetical protein B0J11DRAFT_69843 [Dendryphion nanum]|uniref:Uncharacterized protein n=1 Tax=Dendryphion nanum TaxID=256645 RepID=A0A9P9DJI4_9PLEO|nr:hypothetical protein B0J11DRAFT_69843 [Dendryphion nanum]
MAEKTPGPSRQHAEDAHTHFTYSFAENAYSTVTPRQTDEGGKAQLGSPTTATNFPTSTVQVQSAPSVQTPSSAISLSPPAPSSTAAVTLTSTNPQSLPSLEPLRRNRSTSASSSTSCYSCVSLSSISTINTSSSVALVPPSNYAPGENGGLPIASLYARGLVAGPVDGPQVSGYDRRRRGAISGPSSTWYDGKYEYLCEEAKKDGEREKRDSDG